MNSKNDESNPWITNGSKIVYKNPWITVNEDDVICPDGSKGIYSVVKMRVATGVLAINENDEVYLVGQYRYPTKNYSWEIIEGGAEEGEKPIDAIKRELQEEAGLIAATWEPLSSEIHLSNCHSSERAYLFIAKDLTATNKSPDTTEVLKVKTMPFAQLLEEVVSGKIVDAMTIMAVLLYSAFRK